MDTCLADRVRRGVSKRRFSSPGRPSCALHASHPPDEIADTVRIGKYFHVQPDQFEFQINVGELRLLFYE